MSNGSINATLAVLAQVWDAASKYSIVSGKNRRGATAQAASLAGRPRRGRMEVVDAKTSAGRRQVPLTPLLRESLVEHRAASMGEGYVFPSAASTMRDRHALRNRTVAAAVKRANQALEAAGEPCGVV